MLNSLLISRAQPGDAMIVSSMIRESFRKQAGQLGIRQAEYPHYVAFESPAGAEARINRTHVLLLQADSRLAGTVGYNVEQGKGSIERLAVLPACRGQQYGEYLLNVAEDELRRQGCRSVQLSIVASFGKLQRYYERLGYRPAGLRTFASLPFEVLYMDKSL